LYLYWHDTRDNGHGDPSISTVLVELEECLSLEEELSDDKVSPGIHFLLQMQQVVLITGAVWMAMGVPCGAARDAGG
jgi:hypothetical protein